MCILITGTIPKNIKKSSIQDLIDKYDFAFELVQNEYIIKQLDGEDAYIKATKYGCDCNTGLCSSRILNIKADINKLKKSGGDEWAERTVKEIEERNNNLKEDAHRWKKFINELLNIDGVNEFGLLIHFYNSGLNESGEKFDIKRTEYVNLKNVSVSNLTKMEENVLYKFVKD